MFQMASHARDILNFKYYRDTNGGNRERAEEIIKAVCPLNQHFSLYFSQPLFPSTFYLRQIK